MQEAREARLLLVVAHAFVKRCCVILKRQQR